MCGGFYVHVGEVVGCVGPLVVIPAMEHAFLVQEAERSGCPLLASLRYSHPDEQTADVPGDRVLRELDVLLGDPPVDDRARETAKRIRALWDRCGAGREIIVFCGVGTRPHVHPAWTDPLPEGIGVPPLPVYRPLLLQAGPAERGSLPPTPTAPGEATGSVPGTLVRKPSRIDFFPYGTVHRGRGPSRSKPVDARGLHGMTVTAWAGLDCGHPWAGAICRMQTSKDGKTWVDVGDPLLPGPGGRATAVYYPMERWIRTTVELSHHEAEIPVSVHGWPIPIGPEGEPPL